MNTQQQLSAMLTLIAIAFSASALRAEIPFRIDAPFQSKDSLDIGEEPSEDARDCLQTLCWTPTDFEVTCLEPTSDHCDALVRFPSPLETGDEVNDRVAMEWYFARDQDGEIIEAPAIIVVHESGRGMAVGRLIAKSLTYHRFHAFMIQLPGYGERRDRDRQVDEAHLINLTRQAVADVRRARDAVEVLPLVDTSHIGVQGTSLGGFVTATAASIDNSFDSVHLMLAGGDLFDVIQNGQHDAASLRRRLAAAGYSGEALRELLLPVEPNRIAHRMNPERVWLYSGKRDTVVPPESSISLAKQARLPDSHHIQLNCTHYSGAVFLPIVLDNMENRIRDLRDKE